MAPAPPLIHRVNPTPVTVAPQHLIVLSEEDPVARAVGERFGTLPAVGEPVDGAPIRGLTETTHVLRRPGRHIFDNDFDQKLPRPYRSGSVPAIFPSIHRSESGVRCLTVHPIGNPGHEAAFGGRPRTLVPTSPRLMAQLLRSLSGEAHALGLRATFESTHHGPALGIPAMFVEIGWGEPSAIPAEAIEALARLLRRLPEEAEDRIAVGIGGGHYAPHFTELVLKRRWAFGHLLSRHTLSHLDPTVLEQAWSGTPGASGWLLARAADWPTAPFGTFGRRLKDTEAPDRAAGEMLPQG